MYNNVMIAFGHTAVGTIVGVSVIKLGLPSEQALPIALGIGIISHYMADFIPHGHFFKAREFKSAKILLAIVFDLFLSLLIFSALSLYLFGFSNNLLVILFAIAGSQLPDCLDGLIRIDVIPKKGLIKNEFRFHQLVHWHGRENNGLMWGKLDIWQVLTVFLGLYLLFTV